MRRVDAQLNRARKDAAVKDATTTKGIEQNTLLEYINDAQDRAQALISSSYALFNIKEDIQSTVVDQEAYSITDYRVYINNRFVSFEISSSGNLQDYCRLKKSNFHARNNNTGLPEEYLRRGASVLLNPIPDSTAYKLRVNYEAEVEDLDIRRGKIASIIGAGTPVSPITSITLASSSPTPDGTDTVLADLEVGDYICVVDKDGNRIAKNLPVTGYSSLVITVDSFELGINDTLPAVGDYVCVGKYKTTHSELPDTFDNYLVLYVIWRILGRKGSTAFSKAAEAALVAKEKEILEAYVSLGQEIQEIPYLD